MCSVDLALTVDKTASIGKYFFNLLKGFLLQISDAMVISPDRTHEAVITYDNVSTVLNTFDERQYHSNEAMHMLIDNIDTELGSPTRTDRALVAADDKLFTVIGGDRPNFRNVLVLFTDGKTNPASQPYDEIIPSLEVRNGSDTMGCLPVGGAHIDARMEMPAINNKLQLGTSWVLSVDVASF